MIRDEHIIEYIRYLKNTEAKHPMNFCTFINIYFHDDYNSSSFACLTCFFYSDKSKPIYGCNPDSKGRLKVLSRRFPSLFLEAWNK